MASAFSVRLGCKDNVYRTLDQLLAHKQALFTHLRTQWEDLFGAKFEVLLYDLTSTYFESDPAPFQGGKRRFGYSRDKRPDCVQVVIALVMTPEGFPIAYQVMAGNTSDKTTLEGMLQKIEAQYGEIRGNGHGGRAFSDDRWAQADLPALHQTPSRPGHDSEPIEIGTAAPGPTTDQFRPESKRVLNPNCGQTFKVLTLIINDLHMVLCSSSESRVNIASTPKQTIPI